MNPKFIAAGAILASFFFRALGDIGGFTCDVITRGLPLG